MTTDQKQPELFRSEPTDVNVAWLEKFLVEQHDWVTARQILERINYPVTDDKKRWLRQLAEASPWIISGQRGYRNIKNATPEEIQHATAWLESQARKMSQRAGRLRRNAHRILH